VSASDVGGLVSVAMLLLSFAATSLGRWDPQRAPALLSNLIGAALVLWSLSRDFNLSATVMETAWFLVAAAGLARLAFRRRS
jgi:hypothetical protein